MEFIKYLNILQRKTKKNNSHLNEPFHNFIHLHNELLISLFKREFVQVNDNIIFCLSYNIDQNITLKWKKRLTGIYCFTISDAYVLQFRTRNF